MRPTYLALRFFHLRVRKCPEFATQDPSEMLDVEVLHVLDRMISADVRQWVAEVYQTLNRPTAQDQQIARSFEDAEARFLGILYDGQMWENDRLMNELGKVGTDLTWKVPFLF